ncbi:mitochondrial import inner membrane translocase subunit TIM10 isoform X2 [Cryptomeria japonica]|nr:mitochondrial import inner membrane translocase subunit TIM10 isoform X2 [Cryptomeria japonica]XP_059077474.1 mitochondrial import inner membrane translocase subunit TIM10 isoform X2 [Cryptomeria japonica]
MAEQEMAYRVELFNKLTQTCFDKCIEKRYKESELNMGENSCIDRCVAKYWQNMTIVYQLQKYLPMMKMVIRRPYVNLSNILDHLHQSNVNDYQVHQTTLLFKAYTHSNGFI